MQLIGQQQDVFTAIEAFMRSDASVFILRGYAGTGKTTMVKIIADYIAQTRHVSLMAPTGRAARVLAQKTDREACTIHKAIYAKAAIVVKQVSDIAESEFKFVFPIIKNEHGGNLVAIVDEASMVCSRKIEQELFAFGTDNLLEDLLEFVRPQFGGKVIFVGDPAQLPPVGESVSNALRAEYFTERGLKVQEAELTEVIRQSDDSLILKNAMMIRDLLECERRSYLVFEEKKGDVETVPSGEFLNRYLDCRVASGTHDSVVICYTNRAASRYNRDIRTRLYGGDVPIRKGDILLIVQNNYRLGRMNGEFVPVLEVGARTQQSAPVYSQVGGERKRILVTVNFVQVVIPDVNGIPMSCMLIEDLLTSDKGAISIDENRALYINFCMRNPGLRPGSEEFAEALMSDTYYNAVRAKYGYAVTGHKCQGGEWGKVFVDYAGRTGLNDDCLRWAYTATTRARKTLYVTNLPHITPFSRFRIVAIQKSRAIDPECRIIRKQEPTPFHGENAEDFLKAKYHCIVENMEGTPFAVLSVMSRPYMESYQVQTPRGVARFDLKYKEGGMFNSAQALVHDEYTDQVLLLLNDERQMPLVFDYTPSDELHEKLYNMIRSACDSVSVQLTNVVEQPEHYFVVYYMRTSGTYSYITLYFDADGFVTYAKPMSMLGAADGELNAIINELKNHMI